MFQTQSSNNLGLFLVPNIPVTTRKKLLEFGRYSLSVHPLAPTKECYQPAS